MRRFLGSAGSTLGAAIAISAIVAMTTPLPAMAAGTVTQCGDDTQLSNDLAGGGLVTFNCGTATVGFTSHKTIATDTTLDGGGKITLSADGMDRLFVVSSGVHFTLRNIVLRDGYAPGNGGAILNQGTLVLDHARITGGEANTGSGGAIFTDHGRVTMTHSTLDHNRGVNAGAIAAIGPGSDMIFTDSSLHHNVASGASPDGNGGAVLIGDGSTLRATRSDFYHNTAVSGGAIDIEHADASMVLTDSFIRSNSAEFGGALFQFRGRSTFTGVLLSGNDATGGTGGALTIYDANVKIYGSNIIGNHSDVGGGIFTFEATLRVRNSTISGNSSTSGGGGAFFDSGLVTLINVTIAENGDTGPGGGDIYNGNAELHLTNVLLAASTGGGNCRFISGAAASHSLSSDGSCNLGSPYDNADVRIGPLDTNGGPMPTYRLLPSSAAIIEGTNTDCPSTDQRGVHRPMQGTCDVGAFEYTPCDGKPAAPTDLLPVNRGAMHADAVRFDWVGQDCATRFGITVRRGSKTGAIAFSSSNLVGSIVLAPSLPAGTYYWQTKACNWSGCTAGPWLKVRLVA